MTYRTYILFCKVIMKNITIFSPRNNNRENMIYVFFVRKVFRERNKRMLKMLVVICRNLLAQVIIFIQMT